MNNEDFEQWLFGFLMRKMFPNDYTTYEEIISNRKLCNEIKEEIILKLKNLEK